MKNDFAAARLYVDHGTDGDRHRVLRSFTVTSFFGDTETVTLLSNATGFYLILDIFHLPNNTNQLAADVEFFFSPHHRS